MEKLTLNRAAELSVGRLGEDYLNISVEGVSTDSREIKSGDLFIALKGDRFDGHAFLDEVAKKGAVAAMVNAGEVGNQKKLLPLILVEDTLAGLQNMAKNYRSSLGVKAVAVAGSNGKTGSKEMIAEVLATKFSVQKNRGNLNNHIGVPLTLLGLDRKHQVGVFEVGTNHPGELRSLLQMVQPVVGVITVIGEEHLEYFHDLKGVAEEEGTVAEVLPKEGLMVLNADDEWSAVIAKRCKSRVVKFGTSKPAEYSAKEIKVLATGTEFVLITPKGEQKIKLKLLGRHQVNNALAAAAVGEYFGLSLQEICKGLEAVVAYKMRMERFVDSNGVVFVNDAYNSNPSSVRAALDALNEFPVEGRRIAVLGEMLELGDTSLSSHRDIGKKAAECKLDLLMVVGDGAKSVMESARAAKPDLKVEFFSTAVEAQKFLKGFVKSQDVVLLKASRGIKLEQILEGWK